MLKSKIYFPNLNGLRFIAASLVLLPHVEQIKSELGLEANFSFYPHHDMGKLGVILFFTLSGFLITYLLMAEKLNTGTISIRKFFVRRELRIAPLYYLLVLFSFFILPNIFDIPQWNANLYENFSAKLFLYLIFAPNLAISLFPAVPFAGQAWSIGVEEQFYFVWAFLAKKTASFLKMLIGVIVFYLTVKIGLLWAFYVTENSIVKFASNFWGFFTIDAMAIGGLAAYCLFNNKNLNIVFSKLAQIGIYALAAILIVLDFQIPFFTYEIFSIIFALIILNLAGNAHSIVNLENELLSYLGKISYGIYMYHVIAITVAVKLSSYFSNSNLLIYLTAFALTVLISTVSYELFENTFIRAKVKFSVVISGDNGKGGPFCPPLPEVKPQEF